MYAFNNLMVGLDFTSMDRTLIEYTASIVERIDPTRIYFVHVQPNLDIPDEAREFLLQPDVPVDEQLAADMKDEVAKYFVNAQDYEIHYEVIEGRPTREMLRWAHIKQIDLLIMGRKLRRDGSGVVSEILARKVMCSVLFVPDGASFHLDRLLVPVDFSEYSKMALEEAAVIVGHNPNAVVHTAYAFQLPSGYYYSGKTAEEFSEILKNNAMQRFEKFTAEFSNLKLEPSFQLDPHDNPAEFLHERAQAVKADLIIAGARGRSMAAAFLLGSVTEKLLRLDTDIPLLIVKRKDKAFNIWDTIKAI